MATRRSNGEGSAPYKRPDGRWQIKIRTTQTTTGEPIRKTIYGKTRAEAVSKAKLFMRSLEDGAMIDMQGYTLDQWLEHWLEHIAKPGLRERSYRDYQQQLNRWIIGTTLGRTHLASLTALAIERQLGYMRAEGKAEATILKIHRLLSKALKDAQSRGLIHKHPMLGLKAPKAATDTGAALTTEQTRKLVNAAKADYIHGLSFIIALALGLRQGERLGLTWDDIDLRKGTITIRRALALVPGGGYQMVEPKSAAGYRTVPVPPQLIEIFKDHRTRRKRRALEVAHCWNTKPDVHGNYWDLVCVDFEGNRLLPGQDRHAWKEFLRRNDVPEIRVHDARHTAATTLLGLGVAPRIVMQMMGWSSMAMLNRYQHVLDEMEREAASKVGEAIFSAQIISLDERRELA